MCRFEKISIVTYSTIMILSASSAFAEEDNASSDSWESLVMEEAAKIAEQCFSENIIWYGLLTVESLHIAVYRTLASGELCCSLLGFPVLGAPENAEVVAGTEG